MNWKFNLYLNISTVILFIVLLYSMIIYPRKKKQQKHKNIINNVKINDEIITKGGIIGKIIKIKDKKYITLLINKKNKILINKKYIIKKNNKKLLK